MNSGWPRTGNPEVARVSVAKRIEIPPNSAAQVPCKMDHPMTDYVIELDKTEKVYGEGSACRWGRPSRRHCKLL